MKLILEISEHGDEENTRPVILEKFPALIGRGFDNDIILTDPYVSARHLRLDHDGAACTVTDLDSDNGFSVNAGAAHKHRQAHVKSGDTLTLGQTKIRVYAPEHPVEAAIRLQKTHPGFSSWLGRSMNVWACFLLAMSVTLCWSFLEIWTDEPGVVLTAAAAGTIGTVVLWSAIWSVAGRLIKHKAHFKSHAALMCLYMVAGMACWYIEAYTDFLVNGNWVSVVVSYGLNFVLLAFLLYGSLTLATRMLQHRRVFAATVFPAAVTMGILILGAVSAKNFDAAPPYPATLEPYLSELAAAATVQEFTAGNRELFASAEFSMPKK